MTIGEMFDYSDQYWDDQYDEETDMNTTFSSLHDAHTWYINNSGLIDWDWFDGFDEQDLVKYLYRNADGSSTFDELLRGFLVAQGEDPANYSI